MSVKLPVECRELLEVQRGVISRKQAIGCGLTGATVDRLARTGRWLVVQRGVYSVAGTAAGYAARSADRSADLSASLSADLSREAMLWAATLRVGPGAALSHQTAAELNGLYDEPSSLVHVSVPEPRHIAPPRGIVLHRSSHIAEATQPNLLPPRTRIEHTTLDLAHQAYTFDRAFHIACAACQRRLTTAARLRQAMAARAKMRWRADLAAALGEIAAGVHSLLEYRYVRRVEQPHGLPTALRQARVVVGGRTRYIDDLYAGYGVCVELDGRQAHPDDRRWLDVRRDNSVAAEGLVTLRYGWAEVTEWPCATAAEVGRALMARRWPGPLRPCGPDCTALRAGSGSRQSTTFVAP